MKNTKISLISGLVLTVAFFTSVQISALNKKLLPKQLELIKIYIDADENELKELPHTINNMPTVMMIRAHLARLKVIYEVDGNYTPEQIADALRYK